MKIFFETKPVLVIAIVTAIEGMKATDVYCSGFGFTKICVGMTELAVNEETLEISCSEHCKGFEIMGKDIAITSELEALAKAEYNKYWSDFNSKHKHHARPLF